MELLEKIQILQDKGMSIERIARRCDISPSCIWKWKNGTAIPSEKMMKKIHKGIVE
jgi:transcriptional regulator with XRE-family HTH domain